MLSIIIPARNEEENLKNIFDYFNQAMNSIDYEIVIINDFSTDNTFVKAKSYLDLIKILKFMIMKKRVLEEQSI